MTRLGTAALGQSALAQAGPLGLTVPPLRQVNLLLRGATSYYQLPAPPTLVATIPQAFMNTNYHNHWPEYYIPYNAQLFTAGRKSATNTVDLLRIKKDGTLDALLGSHSDGGLDWTFPSHEMDGSGRHYVSTEGTGTPTTVTTYVFDTNGTYLRSFSWTAPSGPIDGVSGNHMNASDLYFGSTLGYADWDVSANGALLYVTKKAQGFTVDTTSGSTGALFGRSSFAFESGFATDKTDCVGIRINKTTGGVYYTMRRTVIDPHFPTPGSHTDTDEYSYLVAPWATVTHHRWNNFYNSTVPGGTYTFDDDTVEGPINPALAGNMWVLKSVFLTPPVPTSDKGVHYRRMTDSGLVLEDQTYTSTYPYLVQDSFQWFIYDLPLFHRRPFASVIA